MSKEKFTQGGWVAFVGKYGAQEISNNKGSVVVSWSEFDESTVNCDKPKVANAHLIAAAPDMYRKLKDLSKLMAMLDPYTPDLIELDCVTSEIEKLLAKARGE